jgi:hypothetical protein
MHLHLTWPPSLHQLTDIVAYWAFFWNAVYVLCPPRETFNSPKYNKFLDLVSYYGSLNIRGLLMKIYGAPPTNLTSPKEEVK